MADNIQIDLSKDNLFDQFALKRLRDSYMTNSENSPQERFSFISKKLGTNIEHSQRLYDYTSNHWLSLSTPLLSLGGKAKHGLPISCYLVYLEDTRKGLLETLSEVNNLSMLGGGIGIGVNIRSADNKSTGVMTHLNVYDASCLAYKQDGVRRGSYSVYLNIDHPDIIPFLEMRKSTGDNNIRCANLHHCVNITDKFMNLIEKCTLDSTADDKWDLIDPHTLLVKETLSAKRLWQQILEIRLRTGEPNICFIDTCNRYMQPYQKQKGLSIAQSNLCTEIILPTNSERTAVCCISSLNLEKYDEWKDNKQFILDTCEALDNALQLFIDTAPENIKRAKYSAIKERSIGIGVLGFHALLQKKNIGIESDDAKNININIFKHLNEMIHEANILLGSSRGSPEDAMGTGRRFSNTMAVAPNATSSIIMGNTSPGIEPFRANCYRQDTLSGSNLNKNKQLDLLLKQKGVDVDKIWYEILMDEGSVRHISCLSDHEKSVYKTAFEIDQQKLIDLASDRQKFIDQSQSLNLFIRPDISAKTLHSLHFSAWKKEIKTLYYLRSTKAVSTDKLQNTSVKACPRRKKGDTGECLACE